jgi:hypothetical protein
MPVATWGILDRLIDWRNDHDIPLIGLLGCGQGLARFDDQLFQLDRSGGAPCVIAPWDLLDCQYHREVLRRDGTTITIDRTPLGRCGLV